MTDEEPMPSVLGDASEALKRYQEIMAEFPGNTLQPTALSTIARPAWYVMRGWFTALLLLNRIAVSHNRSRWAE